MATYNGISQDAQQIMNLAIAPMYSKITATAIEMELFTLLSEPQTAQSLAEKQNWHPFNTELFLDMITGLGLLIKEQGIFRNTPAAEQYLIRNQPDFIGDCAVAFYNVFCQNANVDLQNMIRNGPANETAMTMDNVSFEAMTDMMRKMQVGGRTAETVKILQSLPEFKNAKKLLDLGSSVGILGINVVLSHPTMQGVLFDVPFMTEAVNNSIRSHHAEDRVKFIGGNFLTDDFGSDYDIVLVIGTMNFAKNCLVPLLEKIHAALNEGGVMVCIGDGVQCDGTGPKDILAGWLVSGLQGMDYRIHRGMIAGAALEAGFRNVQTLANTPTYLGNIDIDILRK